MSEISSEHEKKLNKKKIITIYFIAGRHLQQIYLSNQQWLR